MRTRLSTGVISTAIVGALALAGAALAQGPLQGDVNATFAPGGRPPPSSDETPPPGQTVQTPHNQGISCADAQARYRSAITHLNAAHAAYDETGVRVWNQERIHLEQYITDTLRGCALPNVTINTQANNYRETEGQYQPEQRDANGRLTVEAAEIHHVTCGNGRVIFVYQYVMRHGFRAILPPNWGSPLGGRDFDDFAGAVAAGCGARTGP